MTLNSRTKQGIRWIMGNTYVGTSNLQVAKEWFRRTAKYPRATRRAVVKYALKCHLNNSSEYAQAMGGGHGYTGKRSTGE